MKKWCVYMLRCGDGSLYTGVTNDLERRVEIHNSGKGAKYTRGRGPVEVVFVEEVENESMAKKREWELKKLPKKEKEELVGGLQHGPDGFEK